MLLLLLHHEAIIRHSVSDWNDYRLVNYLNIPVQLLHLRRRLHIQLLHLHIRGRLQKTQLLRLIDCSGIHIHIIHIIIHIHIVQVAHLDLLHH